MLANDIETLLKQQGDKKLPLENGHLKIIDKRGFQAHSISDKDERIYNIPVSEKKSVFRNYIF